MIRITGAQLFRTASLAFALCLLLAGCGGDDKSDKDTSDVMDVADGDVGALCGSEGCPEGALCCDYSCIDPAADAANCGACGLACADGQSCVDGQCSCGDLLCSAAESCCLEPTAACLQLDTDPDNCGACGNSCETAETCLTGVCACLTADGSYESCGADESCCPGMGCVSLDFDPGSCGACGFACGAGELCVQGTCTCGDTVAPGQILTACTDAEACCGSPAACRPAADPECACGTVVCGSGQSCCTLDEGGTPVDTCVSTWREPAHCGTCGSACGAAQGCRGGLCLCQGGVADCNDDMVDGCEARLAIDAAHCGACGVQCAAGEVCDGQGNCDLRCQTGLTDCDGTCVDLNWNRNHCGACNNACAPGEVANGAGQCALSCLAGLTDCGGECVNINGNRSHCGTCGAACAPGEVCDGTGRCGLTCVPGLTDCAGNCVELYSDRAHCGACGNACTSGQVCDAGQCAATCQPGTVDCDGACIDPRYNRFHCGACGNACPSGANCVDGVCGVECPDLPNIEPCDGLCVDITTNRAHCGSCGTTCAAFERCQGGVCVDNCLSGFEVCGQQCVDTDTSASHCGACGVQCGAGEACFDGTCCDAQSGCGMPRDVAVGDDSACAVSAAGAVYCWGSNNNGELGNGTVTGSDVPIPVNTLDGVANTATSVCVGWEHACALLDDGTVRCWGANFGGQLGDGLGLGSLVPVAVVGLTNVTKLVCNGFHTCALESNGTVSCWGQNNSGAVGNGNNVDQLVPVPVSGLTGVYDVATTYFDGAGTCALVPSGNTTRILCWGDDNHMGCPAAMSNTNAPDPGCPVADSMGQPLEGMSSLHGAYWMCATDPAGGGFCWGGYNTSTAAEVTSDPMAGVIGWQQLYARGHDLGPACGLTTDGRVACEGFHAEWAEVGRGCSLGVMAGCEPSFEPGPSLVVDASSSPIRAAHLSSGDSASCAILTSGQLACWGLNFNGLLAIGGTPNRLPAPTDPLPGGASAVTTFADQTCAVVPNVGIYCWGGDLPGGDSLPHAPTLVPGTNTATQVALNGSATCYIDDVGAALCLGHGDFLGNGCSPGSCPPSTTPSPVVGIDGTVARAVSIAAGPSHFCAALDDGTVRCWGDSADGALGLPVTAGLTTTPVAVAGVTDAVFVTASGVSGSGSTCALTSAGLVQCWGNNDEGQLGVVTMNTYSEAATTVVLDMMPRAATAIDCGDKTCAAVFDDGTVWGWGLNTTGAAWSGPTQVPGVSPTWGVVDVAADDHICVVLPDGSVQCRGDNTNSALGDGLTFDRDMMGGVLGLDGGAMAPHIVAVDNGATRSCALTDTGAVWCWGRYQSGEAGVDAARKDYAATTWLP